MSGRVRLRSRPGASECEGLMLFLTVNNSSRDLQLVCCWPEDAESLTTSPWIRHITFIGSEEVGRKVSVILQFQCQFNSCRTCTEISNFCINATMLLLITGCNGRDCQFNTRHARAGWEGPRHHFAWNGPRQMVQRLDARHFVSTDRVFGSVRTL